MSDIACRPLQLWSSHHVNTGSLVYHACPQSQDPLVRHIPPRTLERNLPGTARYKTMIDGRGLSETRVEERAEYALYKLDRSAVVDEDARVRE